MAWPERNVCGHSQRRKKSTYLPGCLQGIFVEFLLCDKFRTILESRWTWSKFPRAWAQTKTLQRMSPMWYTVSEMLPMIPTPGFHDLVYFPSIEYELDIMTHFQQWKCGRNNGKSLLEIEWKENLAFFTLPLSCSLGWWNPTAMLLGARSQVLWAKRF